MVYITKANLEKIIRSCEWKNPTQNNLADIYHLDLKILDKVEKRYLFLIKNLLKEPGIFLNIYQKAYIKDTYTYTKEKFKNQPSYHYNKECSFLQSNFHDYKIPNELKEEIKKYTIDNNLTPLQSKIYFEKEINNYRKWFSENELLYVSNPFQFYRRLKKTWKIESQIIEVKKPNSGISIISNLTEKEIENKIDKIINEFNTFYYNQTSFYKKLIDKSTDTISPGFKGEDNSKISSEDLNIFLKNLNSSFKKPLKDLLIQYYMIKYNPELNFEKKLLEELNFKICTSCYKEAKLNIVKRYQKPVSLRRVSPTYNLTSRKSTFDSTNEKKFTKDFLKTNFSFINNLLSTHFGFTEDQLILHRDKIVFGEKYFNNYIDQIEFFSLGLIFNPILNYEYPLHVFSHEFNSFINEFSRGTRGLPIQFPLDLQNEFNYQKEQKTSVMWNSELHSYYGIDQDAEYFSSNSKRINHLKKHYSQITKTTNFSLPEIIEIITQNKTDYIFKKEFYESVIIYLKKEFTEIGYFINIFYNINENLNLIIDDRILLNQIQSLEQFNGYDILNFKDLYFLNYDNDGVEIFENLNEIWFIEIIKLLDEDTFEFQGITINAKIKSVKYNLPGF